MTNMPESKTDPVRIAEISKMDRIKKMLGNAEIEGRNLKAYSRGFEKGRDAA